MALTVDLILMWFVFSSAQLWVITGSVERCKQYPNPKNGHVVCDKLFRLFCAPECDVGFMFEYKPAVVYMCGPVTGEWFTYPEGENIPWPDCVKRESSKVHNMEDEVATRRAQITQKIHETHHGMFSNNHRMQPVQTGQPDARYLHLFDYIQRAQQVYNVKQTTSLGYNPSEQHQQQQLQLQQQQQQQQQQRQLQLQQQQQLQSKRRQLQQQKQLQIHQQLQRKRQLMEQQKLIQEQNFQREMMEKQRQQRKAFESTPVNNHQQNVVVPQSTSWPRDTTYQNSQGNLQSSIKVDSKPASPGHAAELSAYYSKMPGTLQTNYERNNVATGPEIKAYSMDWSKKTNLIGSPLHDSQVKRIPMKEYLPRVSVSQAAIPTWQQSDLNRVIPSSNKNVANLTLTPLQDKQKDFRVSYQPTNQITSRGVNLNPTSQSQYRISSSISSQLKAGSLLNAPLKTEPAPLLAQKADFSSASSIFQTNNRSAPSMKSKQELNKTSQVEKRGDVEDGSQPQDEPPKKKEKLFYFPIKRDTLIKMLPMNLQAKYRSLRETRNINSSYEAFSNKEKINSTVLEDIKSLQNVTQKLDHPTNISNYKYSIQQIKTGNDSITEYFDLPPQSTSKMINSTTINSSYGEGSIGSKNSTVISSEAFKNSNYDFSPEQYEDIKPAETGIIEEYKEIPL